MQAVWLESTTSWSRLMSLIHSQCRQLLLVQIWFSPWAHHIGLSSLDPSQRIHVVMITLLPPVCWLSSVITNPWISLNVYGTSLFWRTTLCIVQVCKSWKYGYNARICDHVRVTECRLEVLNDEGFENDQHTGIKQTSRRAYHSTCLKGNKCNYQNYSWLGSRLQQSHEHAGCVPGEVGETNGERSSILEWFQPMTDLSQFSRANQLECLWQKKCAILCLSEYL